MVSKIPKVIKAQAALLIATVLWASAFAGIRMGLEGYSPGALALMRFIIASVCMLLMMPMLSRQRRHISMRDRLFLLCIGAFGLGCYNIALNYGEIVVSSGVASFIVSLAPVLTVLFASLFLGERFNVGMIIGMLICLVGVAMISSAGSEPVYFDSGIVYLLIATAVCGLYSVLQKPFLTHYHAIEVTAWIIWGCTLLLLFFAPDLLQEIREASSGATAAVVYLGIFPAAAGYVAWSYGLRSVPAGVAAGYMYYMPGIALVLGWYLLGETPGKLSLLGGIVTLAGVWIVSWQRRKTIIQTPVSL